MVKKRIIIASIAMGLLFWILDALLDYSYKNINHEGFLTILISDAPTHEFFIRPLFLILLIAFGSVVSYYLSKINLSENRYRQLFHNIQDMIFVIDGPPSNITSYKFFEINQVTSAKLGYSKDELLRFGLRDLLKDTEADKLSGWLQSLATAKNILFEVSMLRNDGIMLPVEINASQLDFGEKTAILLIARDISERKRAEKALQESEHHLRTLAAQLLNAQEDERQRISVKLHDEVGQSLMLLKFMLGNLVKKDRAPQDNVSEWGSLLAYIDEVVGEVRTLSRDLSPSVLEELGLSSAIAYLLEEFSEHYGMESPSSDIDDLDDLFSPQIQINIFRVLQEAFSNIVRHASASRITVSAKRQNDYVSFNVEDNGKGFDPKEVLRSDNVAKGIGLVSMQERVRLAGGSLDIWSQPGQGTRITFSVPIALRRQDHATI